MKNTNLLQIIIGVLLSNVVISQFSYGVESPLKGILGFYYLEHQIMTPCSEGCGPRKSEEVVEKTKDVLELFDLTDKTIKFHLQTIGNGHQSCEVEGLAQITDGKNFLYHAPKLESGQGDCSLNILVNEMSIVISAKGNSCQQFCGVRHELTSIQFQRKNKISQSEDFRNLNFGKLPDFEVELIMASKIFQQNSQLLSSQQRNFLVKRVNDSYSLAMSHVRTKKFELAIREFEKAESILLVAPQIVDRKLIGQIFFEFGQCLENLKKYTLAAIEFERAREFDPEKWQVALRLGDLYYKRLKAAGGGKLSPTEFDLAEKEYQKYSRNTPSGLIPSRVFERCSLCRDYAKFFNSGISNDSLNGSWQLAQVDCTQGELSELGRDTWLGIVTPKTESDNQRFQTVKVNPGGVVHNLIQNKYCLELDEKWYWHKNQILVVRASPAQTWSRCDRSEPPAKSEYADTLREYKLVDTKGAVDLEFTSLDPVVNRQFCVMGQLQQRFRRQKE